MNNNKPKLLYFITEDWVFCSHRLPLACNAIKAGYDVAILTNVQDHEDVISSAGIKVIPLPLKRRSMNPFRELQTLWRIIRVYRDERPDIVHHVAIKPVLYGSIAAYVTGVANVVNALTGLGHIFISDRLKARIVKSFIQKLFSVLLNLRKSQLILQNSDDAAMLVKEGLVAHSRVRLIRGAGVSITAFVPSKEPPPPVTVILPARILWDKGVGEFVEAARQLKQCGCVARFVLVGGQDPENPANISEAILLSWQAENVIEWWQHQNDMPSVYAKAHIVCLPSYREGLPKALLEAASSGKPIVTTDVPGCREIVVHGLNGLLVPLKNSQAIADALRSLIEDHELRKKMGQAGRKLVINQFSEEQINKETLTVYADLLMTT